MTDICETQNVPKKQIITLAISHPVEIQPLNNISGSEVLTSEAGLLYDPRDNVDFHASHRVKLVVLF